MTNHASLPARRTVLQALGLAPLAAAALPAAGAAAVAVERRRVPVGDGAVSVTVLRAAGAGRRPAVVMAAGLGGVFEDNPQRFAAEFVRRGITVVGFDHRHFAGSTGAPRRAVDVGQQRADWHAVVRFAGTLPGVDPDRLALWGTSLGGGHVLYTAPSFPALRAVVAQVPHLDGPLAGASRTPGQADAITAKVVQDFAAASAGRPAVEIPFIGRPGEIAMMTAPGAWEYFTDVVLPTTRLYVNSTPARSVFEVLTYSPKDVAARSAVPTLLVCASQDEVTPPQPVRDLAATMRARLVEVPGTHFDVYTGATFRRLVSVQADFLTARLAP